jgi:dTDP-4-dehydrorhamnose 3,5-epimerase
VGVTPTSSTHHGKSQRPIKLGCHNSLLFVRIAERFIKFHFESSLMKINPTAIPDVLLLEPQVYGDERGFFMETYREKDLTQRGGPSHFVQDNHSGSQRGVLRGLHYQIKQAQGKLLRVIRGEVYDVAVDIRRSSPTFGKWVGLTLSEQNHYQLWIPVGFAHGFYVLSEWAEIMYKTTDYYAPEYERTLLWNDPALAIKWPLLTQTDPVLSAKDTKGFTLSQAEVFD